MCSTILVLSKLFWRIKFFPTSWSGTVLSQVWRRLIFEFCIYILAEAVRYLKFKRDFVIIGRDCLVLLKFLSSLCWRMLWFKVLERLCSFGTKLPCVNPTSIQLRFLPDIWNANIQKTAFLAKTCTVWMVCKERAEALVKNIRWVF